MQKSSVIVFIAIILIVILVFSIAIWNAKRKVERRVIENDITVESNIIEQNVTENEIIGNTEIDNTATSNSLNKYVGTWYVNELSYDNSNSIKRAMNLKEKGKITEEEYEEIMTSEANTDIAFLNIKGTIKNHMLIDFTLEGSAPNKRVGKIENVRVDFIDNMGSFSYTDNWKTEGIGTIQLLEDKILLKLETKKAEEGALWGVEGKYELTYKP